MAANMYRVGDYVFFETSSTTPYQIRRIEELNKTPNGNVEAKVMCFYRRRDISSSLIQLADKHQGSRDPIQSFTNNDQDADSDEGGAFEEEATDDDNKDNLSEKQHHQLKHRELFLSRQVETLPATHIRGKCAVTLLNETESLMSYLNKDVSNDAFFYSLVYDPQQKTLLADKGEIRVGQRYQAEIISFLADGVSDERDLEKLEELVWNPEIPLSDRQIDQFLVIARSVGTFARALDCTSTVRQPSLHMSAAAASRDITLYHAMDILHKHNYDISKAIASLVPSSGPVLCRDEMEEWSASEANLFEEALDKYGKDFNDIRQDFLPWKSLKSIVEYYYMWKTTDRYVQQKRIKAAEAESKLKQVYIPNYNKPNPAQITGKMNGLEGGGRACESCYTANSNQWYHWGPMHMQCRLCATCWVYWKKYGGLKMPTRLDGDRPPPSQRPASQESAEDCVAERLSQITPGPIRMYRCTIAGCGKEFRLKAHLARHLATAHGLAIRAGSPRPVMKTRAAFCLITTPLTRISRQVCADILKIRQAARQPIQPINIALIKQECQIRLPNVIKNIKPLKKRKQKSTEPVLHRLGIDTKAPKIAMLQHLEPIKEPAKYLWPKPELSKMVPLDHDQHPKPDLVPTGNGPEPMDQLSPGQPSIMKKRGYEQTNGIDGPSPMKRSAIGVIRQAGNVRGQMMRGSVINHMNGRSGKIGGSRGRKTMMSWMEAPDDVYFVANDATRKLRKQLTSSDFHRAARKPWRKLNVKLPFSGDAEPVVILD